MPPRPCSITAKLDDRSLTTRLTVQLLRVNSVALVPGTVVGGKSAQGTVTLQSPAPSGGMVVMLSSSNTGVATVSPASLQIAAGATTGSFTVNTSQVRDTTTVILSAAANGATKTVKLTVKP
jgi:trimeric autotransporter adhesin